MLLSPFCCLFAAFLRVSYASHDWRNSYVCVTVGRSDMSKFPGESWQGSFTVYSKQWKSISNFKAFFLNKKNALREFLQDQNLLVNLPTGFPASSAILPTILASKQIRKSWYSRPKINYTHSGPGQVFRSRIRVQAFRRKLKKPEGYLAARKKLKA